MANPCCDRQGFKVYRWLLEDGGSQAAAAVATYSICPISNIAFPVKLPSSKLRASSAYRLGAHSANFRLTGGCHHLQPNYHTRVARHTRTHLVGHCRGSDRHVGSAALSRSGGIAWLAVDAHAVRPSLVAAEAIGVLPKVASGADLLHCSTEKMGISKNYQVCHLFTLRWTREQCAALESISEPVTFIHEDTGP